MANISGAKQTKYEQLADELAHLVEIGTYSPGAAVPSVRQMSQQRQVSVSTVLEAYYLLEGRGVLEAKPRSGFYVSTKLPQVIQEPEISMPDSDPSELFLERMITALWRDSGDEKLIKLGVALPPWDLSAANVLNKSLPSIIRRLGSKVGDYAPLQGCEALRTQIARRSVYSGCELTPQEVVITSGCAEALSVCLRAVCKPGDTVAIESPVCFDTLQCLESLGLKALEIPTHPRDGISLEALEFAVETNPVRACLVISNFQNPLGSMMPDRAKQELVTLLTQRGIPLIEDDIFGDLHFGDVRPTVAKAYDDQGLVMLCSSFSKSLCPGYRIGWVAPGRFQKKVEWLKYSSSIATASLAQQAIAELMASGGYRRHMTKVRRQYQRRVAEMRQAVIRYFPGDIRVTLPRGGYLLWIQLPEAIDSLKLYRRALDQGVAITPGTLYSATDRYRNFIRLSAANWPQGGEDGVRRLGRLIKEMM